MKSKIAMIGLLALSLAACNPPQPQLPQLDQPVQQAPVPQAQNNGFDTGDAAVGALAGAAAGYMMGRAGSNNQPVRERTVIIDNRRPSNYGYNSGYGRKTTTTTTTTKRSGFGGSKKVSITKTTRSGRR